MYLRAVHSTFHIPTLYAFLKHNPLGLLTTFIPHPDQPSLQSSHIPWILDVPSDLSPEALATTPGTENSDLDASARRTAGKPLGTLRAHMSRANPQAKVLVAAAKAAAAGNVAAADHEPLPDGAVTLPDEVLIMFTGPVQHYVTPKFYTTTKPDTGKVVPTWNYEAVEAYGRITVYPSTTSDVADEYLSKAIADLSHQSEVSLGYDGREGRAKEWEVNEAPERYIGLLKKSIVGVSVEITRLGGKFKMSQELKEGDRKGVVKGFEVLGNAVMAESVNHWGQSERA